MAFNRSATPQRVTFKADAPLVDYTQCGVSVEDRGPVAVLADEPKQITPVNGRAGVDLPAYGYAVLSTLP